MAAPHLATHLDGIPLAPTMAAAARARAMREAGVDVISLTLGEPGFATPAHIVAAAHEAALRGETKYPPLRGTPALLAAVRAKFAAENGIEYGADEVLVGHGARQMIYDALIATLNPGDEVVIPAPYWNAYPLIARMAQAKPVYLPCAQEDGFLPNPAALDAAITPKTAWVVLNFPNNPSGAVCPAEHLAALAEVLRRHQQLWIMCDEMYEHLIHDGSSQVSLAALAPDLRPRVLTISGVSKTYAMTGWRVGFAGGPAGLIAAMAKVQGQSTGGVGGINQAAALAALTGPQDLVAEMRQAYGQHARFMAAALDGLDGVRCAVPGGAFYVFPDMRGCLGKLSGAGQRLSNDAALVEAMLEEAHVAAVAGSAFGLPGHVRFSTAASLAELERAAARLRAWVAGLRAA